MGQASYIQQFNSIYSAYFKNPASVSTLEMRQVDELLEKFPYCQSLRFIHLASLKSQGDQFQKHLPRASLYAPQRDVLYALMNNAEDVLEGIGKRHWTVKDQSSELKAESPNRESAEEDKLILGNIAGGDFFAFERSRVDPLKKEEPVPAYKAPLERVTEAPKKPSLATGVSKYNDDQMPYTFLWWLNKTRNEHATTYQPYAAMKNAYRNEEVLQEQKAESREQRAESRQQTPENRVNTPQQYQPTQSSQAGIVHKDDRIIDRFIREEPQIKPPAAEKIDTENKARKSSEDANDMVSETLAMIYAEQMLYRKAIDTYRKLRLKFPEKSTYFADRIRELEKKAN